MIEPCDLTATEARDRVAAGELSSVDLVQSCLDRVDSVDPAVNAMITRVDELAMTLAVQADDMLQSGHSHGPLHGVPVAIKDLQPTAGITTTMGSPSLASNVPDKDAEIVARIRKAGGIIIGKTNVPEFSIGANTVNPLFGATGNPFDVDLTCGGSSGGSAVALATGMAPLATGSDHGGSLRIPASYCGVVGFRATPGVVPNEGRRVSQTFYSVQGPMGRTVQDTALLLSVIAGRSVGDPMSFPHDASRFSRLDEVDVTATRIGISDDLGGLLVADTIRQTFRDRVEKLSHAVPHTSVVEVSLKTAPSVDWAIRSDLFVAQYGADAHAWPADFNPNIRQSYESAISTPMEDIAAARRTQMELCQSFQSVFDTIDILLVPCVSVPPFRWIHRNPVEIDGASIENYMGWLGLTSALTVVGHPVVALPCGLDSNGTPFGIQVVGSAYDDHRLLSIAAALETLFENDPTMCRPRPDVAKLASTSSQCRELGRTV